MKNIPGASRPWRRAGGAVPWLLAAAVALPAAGDDLARVSAGAAGLHWAPVAPAGTLILIVSGADYREERRLAAGAPAWLSLFDAAGQLLPDGEYDWELTAMPGVVPGAWRDPANGRDAGRPLAERPEPAPPLTQRGSFAVADGRFILPDGGARPAGIRLDADPDPAAGRQRFDDGGLHDN